MAGIVVACGGSSSAGGDMAEASVAGAAGAGTAGAVVGVAGNAGTTSAAGALGTGMRVAGYGGAAAGDRAAMGGGGIGVTAAGASGGAAGAPAAAGAAPSSAGAPGAVAGSSGTAGMTAAAGGGGAAAPSSGKVFDTCRFHFGTTDGIAKNNPRLIEQLDFFTPGWMGLKDTFDMQYVCDYTKPGGLFENKVPAVVAYVSAFYAKRVGNLKDCNAPGAQQDLCVAGASIIARDLDKIVAVYDSYAQGFAACYGTTRPIIFMMEPDFFQYTISNQSQPWSPQQAGKIMSQFVGAIRKHLPNALFSMDVSPWVPPNNGEDNGRQWFSNFDMSLFTFINTSGGGTSASTATIRGSNKMTWRGVVEVTGKPLLADTGYGVNGSSAGHDRAWDDPANINARIMDGVVSISQYNPETAWPMTIASLRDKLGKPTHCP